MSICHYQAPSQCGKTDNYLKRQGSYCLYYQAKYRWLNHKSKMNLYGNLNQLSEYHVLSVSDLKIPHIDHPHLMATYQHHLNRYLHVERENLNQYVVSYDTPN